MIAMACGTVGAAVNFIVGYHNASANTERLSNLMNVFLMAFILAMLVFGAMYLMKGYAKQAANDYKAFMILHIIVCALTIYIDLSFYKVNALMIAISVVNACKAVLLLILAFGKDIGRSRTGSSSTYSWRWTSSNWFLRSSIWRISDLTSAS